MHEPGVKIGAAPCPRCGCYLINHFECGCGTVHDDCCVNCGRWVSLAQTEHVELSGIDARCTVGPVIHEHSEDEKAARIERYMQHVAPRAESS